MTKNPLTKKEQKELSRLLYKKYHSTPEARKKNRERMKAFRLKKRNEKINNNL